MMKSLIRGGVKGKGHHGTGFRENEAAFCCLLAEWETFVNDMARGFLFSHSGASSNPSRKKYCSS